MDRVETEKPDLVAVLDYYAHQLGRDVDTSRLTGSGRRKLHCPFHEDDRASASVDLARGTFRCFACNAPSGDSYDVIMGQEGIGFNDAKQWAADHVGHAYSEVRRAPANGQYRPSWLAEDDD